MLKKGTLPDAWEDDDWETQADKAADAPAVESELPKTKKERLAQHVETNRKLWESAESPQIPFHLATAPSPPLGQPFKAPMTVLARKPQLARRNPVTGLASLALDDSDDEADRKPQETQEEIRTRQQREREEKQRRYEEVRAKIFGECGGEKSAGKGKSNPSSGGSTPGTVTPPRSADGMRRGGRGRGRGSFRGNERGVESKRPKSQIGGGNGGQEQVNREKGLFDPNYAPKPGFALEKRGHSGGGAPLSGKSPPRGEDQATRAPRGPDRGGSGFARRAVKEG